MKYTKPEVTLTNSATVEIQGIPKIRLLFDGIWWPPAFDFVTIAAYEPDE